MSTVYCSGFKNSIIVAVSSDEIAIVLHCHFHTGDEQNGFHFILSTHEEAGDSHIVSSAIPET